MFSRRTTRVVNLAAMERRIAPARRLHWMERHAVDPEGTEVELSRIARGETLDLRWADPDLGVGLGVPLDDQEAADLGV